MPILTGGEREPLRFPDAYVQDELGVLPHPVLPGIDVEGAAPDLTQEDLTRPPDGVCDRNRL